MGLTASEGQRSTMVQVKIEDLKPGMMTAGLYTIVSVQNQPDNYRIKVTFVMREGGIYTHYYARGTLANMLQFTLV
jgi:hypothetical protein